MKKTVNFSVFADLGREGIVDMNVSLPSDTTAVEILETFVRFGGAIGCTDDELRNAIVDYADTLRPNTNYAHYPVNDPTLREFWEPLPF